MHTAAVCTFTPNPALDISTTTHRVVPTDKLRCGEPRYDPGGGGINVARVIHVLGGSATAVYPAGGPAGQMLSTLLEDRDIPQQVVPISGQTRESFTVDEATGGEQFRFVLPGPRLSTEEQRRCLVALEIQEPRPALLVASGSLPSGVPVDFYARVARLAKKMETRFILDTSGEALRQAGREGVYLIKPNLRELAELVGRELRNGRDQEDAARQLLEEGRAEIVVVSLGARGALLASADVTERFPPLEVPIRSAVGAGDSMVGAISLALARGAALTDAIRFGMAAGAATLMTPGTELCRREDVERLYRPGVS